MSDNKKDFLDEAASYMFWTWIIIVIYKIIKTAFTTLFKIILYIFLGIIAIFKCIFKKNPETKEINQYYQNTKDSTPNKNVIQFIDLKIEPGNAIELGCGAGRDTKYLIQNGWKVLAIDRENVATILNEKLNKQEQENLRFKKQIFENLELEPANLIVANFSLSFCNKYCFDKMWKTIEENILPDGYFVGNFFGVKDEWAKTKSDMKFLEKEQVLQLFKNFEIIEFIEIEKDDLTGMGKLKHWHIFNVIAKK